MYVGVPPLVDNVIEPLQLALHYAFDTEELTINEGDCTILIV